MNLPGGNRSRRAPVRIDVLADEWSAYVKASLANDPSEFYQPTGR
ncbi:hypothetical protein [Micromonospora sp. NPDC049204]